MTTGVTTVARHMTTLATPELRHGPITGRLLQIVLTTTDRLTTRLLRTLIAVRIYRGTSVLFCSVSFIYVVEMLLQITIHLLC
jgi:hypothetical protein